MKTLVRGFGTFTPRDFQDGKIYAGVTSNSIIVLLVCEAGKYGFSEIGTAMTVARPIRGAFRKYGTAQEALEDALVYNYKIYEFNNFAQFMDWARGVMFGSEKANESAS